MITIATSHADAKSQTCLRLERQLASLSSNRGVQNPFKALQYSSAISRQKGQINRVNRQMSRGGCLSRSKKKSKAQRASCRKHKKTIGKMQSNLRKLQAKRNGYSGKKRNTGSQRNRIKRALAKNRCNDLQPVIAVNRSGVILERSTRRRSVVEQVYGDERKYWNSRRYRNRGYYEDRSRYPGSESPEGGRYRTVCVRTCDGYFFPISSSTSPYNFDRDAQSCNAKCPGTQTDLYYYSSRGETTQDMISYSTEETYTSLDTAFSFQKAVTAGCGCKFDQPGFTSLAGDGGTEILTSLENNEFTTLATPTKKVDLGEDPETLANKRGSFVPTQIATQKPRRKTATASGKRKVRVVGEKFFPTQ